MTKFILFCTKLIIATLVALLVTSCKYSMNLGNGIEGNGNVKTEKRTINQAFTKVSVSRGIDVIIEQASVVDVEIEADENLIQHITTNVENGTLVVSSDENIDSAEMETVRIKMPKIEGIETTSGANINSKSILKGNSIIVKSSSGSEISADLEYENVTCEATSGSTITLAGKALSLNSSSSSGSNINSENLLTNTIDCEATSGSSTQVHALVSLKAKVSSGASIDYYGTPKNVSKEESSGGSISSN